MMMKSAHAVTALSALAHEHRLDVYRLLVEAGPDGMNAGTIAARLELPSSSLTFHLQHLHRAGLIAQRRLGRQLIYSADFPPCASLVGYLTENCCRGRFPAGLSAACRPPGWRPSGHARGGRSSSMSEIAIHRRPARAAAAALLEPAGLPEPDLTDAYMEHFFYVGPQVGPIALVGVEMCGGDALLRSLVVNPQHRSAGLGQTLVVHAESHAGTGRPRHLLSHHDRGERSSGGAAMSTPIGTARRSPSARHASSRDLPAAPPSSSSGCRPIGRRT